MNIKAGISSGILLPLLLAGDAQAQAERTPRAGESYTGMLFGKPVTALERDRTRVTEIGLGFQWIPDGPEKRVLVPSGGLFFWRNASGEQSRLRALLSDCTTTSAMREGSGERAHGKPSRPSRTLRSRSRARSTSRASASPRKN